MPDDKYYITPLGTTWWGSCLNSSPFHVGWMVTDTNTYFMVFWKFSWV